MTIEFARPLGSKVLVKPEIFVSRIIHGIFHNEDYEQEHVKAVVYNVGPRVKEVQIYETVLMPFQKGEDVTLNGEKYILIEEKELFGVFE